jgi:hypothetical protein
VAGKLLPKRKVLPGDAKTLPPINLLRSPGAGMSLLRRKFLLRSAKIPPFSRLPMLLEPVALIHFF